MEDNKIVFTDWNVVVIKTGDKIVEKPITKYLKELTKRMENNSVSVFYDTKKMEFTIIDNGTKYSVKLPDNLSEEYTSVFSILLEMDNTRKIISNKKKQEEEREKIINKINSSDYAALIKVEEYEVYLEYLKNRLKNESGETRRAIAAKIEIVEEIIAILNSGIVQNNGDDVISSDQALSLIRGLLNQSEVLSEDNRKRVLTGIEQLLVEYKKIGDNHYAKEKGFFLARPKIPKEFMFKIANVRLLISELQKTEIKSKERGGK